MSTSRYLGAVTSDAASPTYVERLAAPASYWIIGLGMGLSTVTAVGWYVGPGFAAALAAVTAALVSGVLLAGAVRITVDDRGLSVGDALLEWPYLGAVTPLDAAESRAVLGVDANVAAYVVARPYLVEAVQVAVLDDADPHPYWVVTTRRPDELAAALTSARPRSQEGAP